MLIYNNNNCWIRQYKSDNNILFRSIHREDLNPSTTKLNNKRPNKKKNQLSKKNIQFLKSLGYKLK